MEKKEKIFFMIILIIILFFGFFFRLKHLNEPMRYDEAFTYLAYASKPIHIALSDYCTNNHLVF